MHSTRYCITAGEATLRQKGEKRWERIERRQKAILTEYRMDIETHNMNVDRIFRRMIEHANNNGDCIVNIGDGVFRPIPGDPVDEKAFHEYIGKELHRARAIQYKRLCMKQTFESWKKIGRDYNALHFDGERQAE
jgi:hypothetical protein